MAYMFLEPNRTPYDIRFTLFGTPIRIHPFYWLVMLVLALDILQIPRIGIPLGLIWIGVLLVSLTVHEMGHALYYRMHRIQSSIVFYGLGGVNIPDEPLPRRSQRICAALAGPFAGFLLMGLTWASEKVEPWAGQSIYTLFLYHSLIQVNLYWGIFNLLPVWPLDGGRVCEEICTYYRPYTGLTLTLKISIGVAITYIVYAVMVLFLHVPELYPIAEWIPPGFLGIIIFGMIAYQNYQFLQSMNSRYRYWDDRAPWER